MQELRLTPISYIVLGFVNWSGETTPYGLKQLVAASVGNFWTLQHAQLYSEPERLAEAGYLTEERERGGRRRKRYSITDKGRQALAAVALRADRRDPRAARAGAAQALLRRRPGRAGPRSRSRPTGASSPSTSRSATRCPTTFRRARALALDAGIASERHQIEWWEAVKVSADGHSSRTASR